MAAQQEGNEIVLKVPCRPEYVRTVRQAIGLFAQSLNMSASTVEEIEIAASEAVANVIRHAYEGSDDRGKVRVRCSERKTGMVVEIADKGCGFETPAENAIPDIDLDREGGLGIIIIKEFMDRVRFVSKPGEGTKVRMTRHAKANPTSAITRL